MDPALVEFGDKHKLVRQVFAVDSRVVSEDEFKEKSMAMMDGLSITLRQTLSKST